MKPVPIPCGTSSEVPVCPARTAVSFVTWTVAGRILSTALDRLGRPELALALALLVPAGVFDRLAVEPEAWLETVALVVAPLASSCERSGEALSEPPQATRKSERMAARTYFMRSPRIM